MHRDFAFIQVAPRRLFVGWGPFEQLPFRREDRPAFFIADFFLDDPHPWRHPDSFEELDVEELASRFPSAALPSIEWEEPQLESFRGQFDSARAAMERGAFKKIVPVVFESGHVQGTSDVCAWLAHQLPSLPPSLWAYGYSHQNRGVIGATPEVLFRSDARGYETMALAGTRPSAEVDQLFSDPKELREHRFVVDDIVRRLAPFGNVEVGVLGALELPGLAHLATPIRFEQSGGERLTFFEMIRRLHPTAALGVSPRTDAGERWLREADRGIRRRLLGAPFGLEREDRSSLALVAIRNVEWSRQEVRIGAGAGLLPESDLEREFAELRHKRQQVKRLFGLASTAQPRRVVA